MKLKNVSTSRRPKRNSFFQEVNGSGIWKRKFLKNIHRHVNILYFLCHLPFAAVLVLEYLFLAAWVLHLRFCVNNIATFSSGFHFKLKLPPFNNFAGAGSELRDFRIAWKQEVISDKKGIKTIDLTKYQ